MNRPESRPSFLLEQNSRVPFEPANFIFGFDAANEGGDMTCYNILTGELRTFRPDGVIEIKPGPRRTWQEEVDHLVATFQKQPLRRGPGFEQKPDRGFDVVVVGAGRAVGKMYEHLGRLASHELPLPSLDWMRGPEHSQPAGPDAGRPWSKMHFKKSEPSPIQGLFSEDLINELRERWRIVSRPPGGPIWGMEDEEQMLRGQADDMAFVRKELAGVFNIPPALLGQPDEDLWGFAPRMESGRLMSFDLVRKERPTYLGGDVVGYLRQRREWDWDHQLWERQHYARMKEEARLFRELYECRPTDWERGPFDPDGPKDPYPRRRAYPEPNYPEPNYPAPTYPQTIVNKRPTAHPTDALGWFDWLMADGTGPDDKLGRASVLHKDKGPVLLKDNPCPDPRQNEPGDAVSFEYVHPSVQFDAEAISNQVVLRGVDWARKEAGLPPLTDQEGKESAPPGAVQNGLWDALKATVEGAALPATPPADSWSDVVVRCCGKVIGRMKGGEAQ